MTEDAILSRLLPRLPLGARSLLGPGDDAAVLAAVEGRVAVTTDILVEGVHFLKEYSSGVDVGRRAAVQNLSDIAAMGARPTGIVVAVAVPPELDAAWLDELAKGLAAECEPRGVGVVGGDLSSGPAIIVSVAAFGDVERGGPVTRSGAKPGGVLALAGRLGDSAAGLAALQAGMAADLVRHDQAPGQGMLWPIETPRSLAALLGEVVGAYRSPPGVIEAGPEAMRRGAEAMIDVSDGLVRDAGRLAEASGVVLDIDPSSAALAGQARRLTPLARRLGIPVRDWVLGGGEDHALLAVFPASSRLPSDFSRIGEVRAVGTGGAGVLVAGRPARGAPGWDHFKRN